MGFRVQIWSGGALWNPLSFLIKDSIQSNLWTGKESSLLKIQLVKNTQDKGGGRKPKCVVDVNPSFITVINYEDSTVEQILPERHMFMGNTYFYGKIVSMFNFSKDKGKKNAFENIMKYKIMSEMMNGKNGGANNGMGNLMMLGMMGNGGFGDMFNFDGIFDFGNDAEKVEEDNQEDEE